MSSSVTQREGNAYSPGRDSASSASAYSGDSFTPGPFDAENTAAIKWIKSRKETGVSVTVSGIRIRGGLGAQPEQEHSVAGASNLPWTGVLAHGSLSVACRVFVDDSYERSADNDLTPTLMQIYTLLSLKKGWNGYDGLPPSAGAVKTAVNWLEALYRDRPKGLPWYPPNVTASAEGEVVLEWWAESKTLTAYIEGGSVEYLKFERSSAGKLREHGDALNSKTRQQIWSWFCE